MKFFGRQDDKSLHETLLLAQGEMERGNWKKADQILTECSKNLDPSKADSVQFARVFSLGAVVAVQVDDIPRGVELARKSVAARERIGDKSEGLATDLNNLGTFLRFDKQLHEAVPILEKAVALHRKAKGDDDETSTRLRINYAQSLIDVDEAERALHEIAEIFETCHRNRYVDIVVEALEMFGETLIYKNVPQHVETMCKNEMTFLANEVGTDSVALSIPCRILGRSYLLSENYDGAAEMLSISHGMRQELLGPDHRMTGQSAESLALCHKIYGRLDTARSLYEQALSVAEKHNDERAVKRLQDLLKNLENETA